MAHKVFLVLKKFSFCKWASVYDGEAESIAIDSLPLFLLECPKI